MLTKIVVEEEEEEEVVVDAHNKHQQNIFLFLISFNDRMRYVTFWLVYGGLFPTH